MAEKEIISNLNMELTDKNSQPDYIYIGEKWT